MGLLPSPESVPKMRRQMVLPRVHWPGWEQSGGRAGCAGRGRGASGAGASRCAGHFRHRVPLPGSGGGPPCPHSHRWVLEVEGCVCKGREWGLAGLGPGRPLTVRGQGPHPAARRPLPGLLGVFSEQTAFLQGFTRDPPRPQQEGDTQCPLLLKTQTKAQPLPHPPAGSPARGSGEPGPGLVCTRIPHLFICSAPWAHGSLRAS